MPSDTSAPAAANRVCIITGASRGIGRAAANRFAAGGYRLVLSARGAAALQQAAAELERGGAACAAVAGDVADAATARRLVDTAVQRFGRLDAVINNAGYAVCKPLPDLTAADVDALWRTNCAAVFHLTQAAWPELRSAGGGVIVNISSVAAFDPFPGLAVYGACKAWVNAFTSGMASEGRQDGIRVLSIAPGAVETQMLRASFPDLPAEATLEAAAVAEIIFAAAQPALAPCSGQTIAARK